MPQLHRFGLVLAVRQLWFASGLNLLKSASGEVLPAHMFRAHSLLLPNDSASRSSLDAVSSVGSNAAAVCHHTAVSLAA